MWNANIHPQSNARIIECSDHIHCFLAWHQASWLRCMGFKDFSMRSVRLRIECTQRSHNCNIELNVDVICFMNVIFEISRSSKYQNWKIKQEAQLRSIEYAAHWSSNSSRSSKTRHYLWCYVLAFEHQVSNVCLMQSKSNVLLSLSFFFSLSLSLHQTHTRTQNHFSNTLI